MRIGTDIIEIERIQAAVERQPRFPAKVLSPSELVLYQSYQPERQMSFLAGRFSVKEAYGKALGSGIGKVSFLDISILPDTMGAPYLEKAPIIEDVHLSISHSRDYATATVIINLSDDSLTEQLDQFLHEKYQTK